MQDLQTGNLHRQTVTHEGGESEYYSALIAIETNPDFIDGNKRISWECRYPDLLK
jgi:hypothetical protein